MNAHARAYGISLGIHALLLCVVLALALVTPRARSVSLNFSTIGQTKAQKPVAPREQKTVTPVAESEQAVPIKQDERETPPEPKTARVEPGSSEANNAPSPGFAESDREAFITAHFRHIRDKIFKNLRYPQIARAMGWTGKVTVGFTVCTDGRIEDISVLESSGFSALDRDAVDTIKKSCPLPRPPMKIALVMPIVYRFD